VSEAIENQYILMESHMTILELEKILAFCSKRAKLALSLIMIMDCIHKGKILNNDISPSNILLYFSNHVDRIYIRVCDWGLVSYTIEDTPSMYDFPTTVEMEKNKRECYWVAPKLFIVYGQSNSITSLRCVQRRHMYTKEVDACLVGKKVQHIWNVEWDKDVFINGPGMNIFYTKLNALIYEDPKTRASLSSVLKTLTSHPFQIVASTMRLRVVAFV
jgi:serine/threonine protein kinase